MGVFAGARRLPYFAWITAFSGIDELAGVSLFSYQSLMPAAAGTPSDENGAPRWKHLRTIRRHPPPLWIPAFAGMDESAGSSLFSYQSLIPVGTGTPSDDKSGRWLAGLLYEGSELGSATGLPAAGDKPQPYIVLFRLETKLQLEEVI